MKNWFNRTFFKLPKRFELNAVFSSFTKREWHIFIVFVLVLIFSTMAILQTLNQSFMVSVPMNGGTIKEGIIGTPRFVNPLLAFSDADKDMTTLVYSGLMRKDGEGNLIPDLAEKYEITKEGLVYTFTLKNNLYFHDNKPVTVDDIIFTIDSARDPVLKSPHKADWDGVMVDKVNDKTIQFTLKQPYASFLENTTLGVLPAHIWSDTPIELNEANVDPVGSGPYKITEVSKQSSGIISSYNLSSFSKFALGQPYIKNLTLNFYPNEEDLLSALENGEVDHISSVTPENAEKLKEKKYKIESSVLPRVFGLFFNQNQNQIFTNKNVVKAINLAIDKKEIVEEVLYGYGVVLNNPIPPNMPAYQKASEIKSLSREENLALAKDTLAKDGWSIGSSGFLEKTTTDSKKKKTTTVLEFTISTGNAPELAKSAQLIERDLSELGMKVDVKTFEIGNLNQSVIRPRNYDALLFGQIINHESDLFAFWHSSQRKDPGLNVAMYTNAKVDKILEDAFVTADETKRTEKYVQFEEEIRKDIPAVFLYSPKFIYVVSENLQGLSMKHIISPMDRFSSAYLWYVKMDNVWKIFANK